MAPKIRLEGTGDLRRALIRAGDLADEALASAMVIEQEAVISEAKARTPVDTGVLRASGTVLQPEISKNRIEVTAGFGGAAQGYAVVVHEKQGVHHNVGQAKFLESAFLERASKIPANLARRVDAAWQRLRK